MEDGKISYIHFFIFFFNFLASFFYFTSCPTEGPLGQDGVSAVLLVEMEYRFEAGSAIILNQIMEVTFVWDLIVT